MRSETCFAPPEILFGECRYKVSAVYEDCEYSYTGYFSSDYEAIKAAQKLAIEVYESLELTPTFFDFDFFEDYEDCVFKRIKYEIEKG